DLLRIVADWEREHPEAAEPPALVPVRRTLSAPINPSVAEAIERVRPDNPLYIALRTWRTDRARADGVPAYTIFSDRTLRELVATAPRTLDALHSVWGLGEARINRLGDDLLEVIREHEDG